MISFLTFYTILLSVAVVAKALPISDEFTVRELTGLCVESDLFQGYRNDFDTCEEKI